MQDKIDPVQVAFSDGFVGITREELEAKPDSTLAQRQSVLGRDDAEYILIDREWQRRMIEHQLTAQYKLEDKLAKVNRWWAIGASLIGVAGSLAGVWLGLVLAKSSGSTTDSNPAVVQSTTTIPSAQPTATTTTQPQQSAMSASRSSSTAARK